MAVAPTDSLYNKVRDLNVRRNQDWARFGASIVPAVSAGMQGGPAAAAATARGFYPSPSPSISPEKAALLKKDVLDSIVAANKDRRSARLGLVSKLESQDKAIDKIAPAVASMYGSYNTANVASTGDQIRQRTELIKDANDQLARVAASLGGNTANVDRAMGDLAQYLTPGGVKDAGFSDAMRRYLSPNSGLTRGEQQGLLARLGMEANLLDAQLPEGQRIEGLNGIVGILAGGAAAGDPAMQQSLALANEVMQKQNQIEDATIALRLGRVDAELGNQIRSGGASPEKAKEFARALMEVFGASPEDEDKKLGALMDMIDPKAGEGSGPVDAQRYADLLDSIDSETAPANLAEARRRLIEDPEFQAWMKANGFQDPGIALKELRRLMRQRAHEGRQHDLGMVRERRLAEVGPDTNVPASAKAVESGVPGSAPSQDGPAFVFDGSKVWQWDGETFAEATPEDLDRLAAAATTNDMSKIILGPENMDRYKAMAEAKAKAVEPAPEAPAPKRMGPTIPMLQEQGRYAVAHPGEMLGNLERLVRSKVMDIGAKKRKRVEDQAVVNETLHPGMSQ